MDFTPTGEQRDLAALARRILTDRVTGDRLREVEAGADRYDPKLWTELAGAGILGAALPTEYGGAGLGLLEQCSVLVELGRTVAPVPYLASIVLGASALAEFGDPAQRRRWLGPALRGEAVLTAAPTFDGALDGNRLTGSASAVPAAGYADLILVPVGSRVVLVESGDAGVAVRRQHLVDGHTAGLLDLDGVQARFLGGADAAAWLLARGTVGTCALQLGICERALELTASYAGTRIQFDRPIGTFQAVAQRLADAYIDVEAIRLTLWQAAWRLAAGLPAAAELAVAKFWAADAGHRVAHTAVHVHGGVGLDTDYPLHRYFTAAKRQEFALGAAIAQLLALAAALP